MITLPIGMKDMNWDYQITLFKKEPNIMSFSLEYVEGYHSKSKKSKDRYSNPYNRDFEYRKWQDWNNGWQDADQEFLSKEESFEYNEGFDSFTAGSLREDNPYSKNDQQKWQDWNNGWDDSEKELESE